MSTCSLAPNIKKVVLIGQSIGCNAMVQLLNERSKSTFLLLQHFWPDLRANLPVFSQRQRA